MIFHIDVYTVIAPTLQLDPSYNRDNMNISPPIPTYSPTAYPYPNLAAFNNNSINPAPVSIILNRCLSTVG